MKLQLFIAAATTLSLAGVGCGGDDSPGSQMQVSGVIGRDGLDGRDGAEGARGPAGPAGPAATNGVDGRDGRDGRYYCRRDNGTTGLIIGAAGGALVGRAIDTRGERATGTIVGAVCVTLAKELKRPAHLTATAPAPEPVAV